MSNRFEWPELTKSIQDNFKDEINKIIERITDEATIELVDKIRERTGSIAAKILQSFDYTQDQQRLVITINVKELKNT